MTGQNFTTDQLSKMCRKATENKLIDGHDLLNPEKQSYSSTKVLNYLEMKKYDSYIALLQDHGSHLFRVSKKKENLVTKILFQLLRPFTNLMVQCLHLK
jgi:hypothetical protein